MVLCFVGAVIGITKFVSDEIASAQTVQKNYIEDTSVPVKYRNFIFDAMSVKLKDVKLNGDWKTNGTAASDLTSSSGSWTCRIVPQDNNASFTLERIGKWIDADGVTHDIDATINILDQSGGTALINWHGNMAAIGACINFGSPASSMKRNSRGQYENTYKVTFTYSDTHETVPSYFCGVTGFNDLDGGKDAYDNSIYLYEGVELLDGFDGVYIPKDNDLTEYGTNGYAGNYIVSPDDDVDGETGMKHRLSSTWTGSSFTFRYSAHSDVQTIFSTPVLEDKSTYPVTLECSDADGNIIRNKTTEALVKLGESWNVSIPNISGYKYRGLATNSDQISGTIGSNNIGGKSIKLIYDKMLDLTYCPNYPSSTSPSPVTETYAKGATQALPDASKFGFAVNGYDFVSWNTSPDGSGTAANAGSRFTLNDNTKLYAQWKLKELTVTFVDGFGNTLSRQTVKYGSSANAPADPSYTGKTFSGWDKDFTNVTQDTVVTAMWDTNRYTVTFRNGYGNNDTIGNVQSVPYGGSATEPTRPSRTGYNFSGWDKGFTNITSNTTVTAQWEANTYRVHYDKNSANASGSMSDQTMRYDSESLLSSNKFTCTGYTFSGWNTERNGSGTQYYDQQKVTNLTNVDNDAVTLYAQWKANKYTIKFTDGNGTALGSTTVDYGEPATSPSIPSRDGYKFVGWDKDFSNVTSDVTVNALWEPIKYIVRYDKNSDAATGNMPDVTVKYDATANISRNSYTFAGHSWLSWNTRKDGAGTTYSENQQIKNLSNTDGDVIVLYAQWNTDKCTVTFTDGCGKTLSNQSVDYGSSASVPEIPSRSGYQFNGWDKKFDNITEPSVTVNATWKANNYTIVYDKNNSLATGSTSAQGMTYDIAAPLNKNGFSRPGYTWAGWSVTPNGPMKYSDAQTAKNLADINGAIVTLYAIWQPNNYKIIYDKNDSDNGATKASGNMQNQIISYDVRTKLNKNKFSRVGYVWNGWNTSKDGSGTGYHDQQEILNIIKENSGTVTLYAQWTINKLSVTFTDGQGTTLDTKTVDYGSSASAPKDPTRTGYQFSGWDKKFDNVTSDMTVNAEWAPISYKVEYDKNSDKASGTMIDQSMEYDRTYALSQNSFFRKGYAFSSWNTASDGTNTTYNDKQNVKNLSSTDGSTVKLFAQWEPNKYKIRYNSNIGNNESFSTDAVYDKKISIEQNRFERTGYSFICWNSSGSGNEEATRYDVNEQVTNLTDEANGIYNLYAQWRAHSYTIRYDKNASNATGTMSDQQADYDATFNLSKNNFSRPGYTFRGWAISNDDNQSIAYSDAQAVRNLSVDDNGVVILYAVWDENAPITIKYETKDPEHSSVTSKSENIKPATGSASGSTCNVSDGYNVIGWEDVNGNMLTKEATIIPERSSDGTWKPATYYAVTAPIEYQIMYMPNDDDNGSTKASGIMPNTEVKYNENKQLEKNKFTRPGYKWIGWKISDDDEDKLYSDNESVTNLTKDDGAIVTMFAQWEPNSYTISYDKNADNMLTDVVGDMSDQELCYDEQSVLEKNTFSSTGYYFCGWNTERNGTGTSYTDQQEVINLLEDDGSSTTLYAQWRIKEFDVKFIDGNGNILSQQRVSYGSNANIPEDPQRDGYKFSGWDKGCNKITSDTIINAKWNKLTEPNNNTEEKIIQQFGDNSDIAIAAVLAVLASLSATAATATRRYRKHSA